ncbi:MAG: hypothetical protein KDC38_19165, partial [Planctomycetes bacterium]|nr:hypothetical protein [Planctomycetota bacterium]
TIQYFIEQKRFLPLSQFFRQPDEEFVGSEEAAARNYAQAWSFMHFVLHSKAMKKDGPKTCRKYFKLLREGHPRDKAYQDSFGKLNLKAVQDEWLEYMKTL